MYNYSDDDDDHHNDDDDDDVASIFITCSNNIYNTYKEHEVHESKTHATEDKLNMNILARHTCLHTYLLNTEMGKLWG